MPGEISVLIVEDEWFIAIEIEATLESLGYTVVGIAVSAEEAIAKCEVFRPTIATMDMRLHGHIDGIETALELYSRFRIRCLFISAYANDDIRERVETCQPLGWIQKPFHESQLREAVTAAVKQVTS